jgi:hypothetical protein
MFFEILVRIAIKKYVENSFSFQDAFIQLIEQDLLCIDLAGPEEFRRNEIYTNEMDMMLRINSDQLHTLYDSLTDPEFKSASLATITKLLTS